jgi:2-methylisocitrate lyase-like PEP mutase family enzyme
MSKKTSRRAFVRTAGIAATGIMGAGPSLSAATPPRASTMQGPTASTTSKGARFRQLLQRPEPFHCLNCFDGPSARLVELAGFESIFLGGSLTALENGLPDWGLTTVTELLEFASRIAENVDIPVLGDADNGGGNPLTVYRTTQAFERAGLGGVMFEDRIRIERIGQSADVIPTEQMVGRIHAAVDARSDLAIIARSDALAAGLSMEEALDRGMAYAEAGADAILYPGVQPIENMRRAAAALEKPLLAQIGPEMAVAAARDAGVQVLFYTSMLQDIALAAYNQALTELKTTGMVAATYNAHRLPRELTAQLEHSAEILERAAQYNAAP